MIIAVYVRKESCNDRLSVVSSRFAVRDGVVFFFKQKTAYEIGLGIPAEPLFRSAFHDETGRLNVDGMNIISNDGSNKLNRSRKARVSYKVQRTINASLNAATSTRAVSSNPNFVTRQKIEIIFG